MFVEPYQCFCKGCDNFFRSHNPLDSYCYQCHDKDRREFEEKRHKITNLLTEKTKAGARKFTITFEDEINYVIQIEGEDVMIAGSL